MGRSRGANLLLFLVSILLVVLILGQISSVISKVGKEKEDISVQKVSTDNNEVCVVVSKDQEQVCETEHEERRVVPAIYDSFLSPKKILSYTMPFLEEVEVENEERVEKSIFTKLNITEIKTTTCGTDDIIDVKLEGDGPHFLIYHTHTSEAFRMEFEGQYEKTTDWRTDDQNYNVVGVGAELKRILEEDYGYSVLQDKTDHEPPKLSTSYSRSVITMENYRDKYEGLKVYIDVHRDAANVEEDQDDVVVIDGKRCARVMFVVGTGVNFNVKPAWETNYKIALALTEELNAICENFAKPIRVKDGRYNQHISNACILIEVGHNANTYSEAINSVEYIAKAIDKIIEK